MTTHSDTIGRPSEPEAPPVTEVGVLGWIKDNFFSSVFNGILTIVTAYILFVIVRTLIRFIFVEADWTVVTSNLTLFAIGQYPRPEAARPLWALLFVLGLGLAHAILWNRILAARRVIIVLWFLSFPIVWVILSGFAGFSFPLEIGGWWEITPFKIAAILFLLSSLVIVPLLWFRGRGARTASLVIWGLSLGYLLTVLAASEFVGNVITFVSSLLTIYYPALGIIVLVMLLSRFAQSRDFSKAGQELWQEYGISKRNQTLIIVLWPLALILLGAVTGILSSIFPDAFQSGPILLLLTPTLVSTTVNIPPLFPELLPPVRTQLWSGLLLTLMLTIVGIVASFPLGVLLALGRRSDLPIIKVVSTAYIELIRGVPLISILFMAQVMLPLFTGADIDVVIRAMAGVTLFSAAYLAEIVRGGLQAIPKGQIEAADALGLRAWQVTGLIVLPQALRIVIPAIVGQFISLFKDTTLVSIITLLDLLGITEAALAQDPEFQSHKIEAYLFIGVIYFVFSYLMSSAARRIEASGVGMGGTRRL